MSTLRHRERAALVTHLKLSAAAAAMMQSALDEMGVYEA